MKSRAAIVATAAAVAAIPAAALAAPQFSGQNGKTFYSLSVKGSGDHITKVKTFEWDGFKCGQDRFTGGTSRPIKVKDGAFDSRQPVSGVQVPLRMHVKGHFTNHGTKAHGTLKITHGCTTGKMKWSVTLQDQQQGQQG